MFRLFLRAVCPLYSSFFGSGAIVMVKPQHNASAELVAAEAKQYRP